MSSPQAMAAESIINRIVRPVAPSPLNPPKPALSPTETATRTASASAAPNETESGATSASAADKPKLPTTQNQQLSDSRQL